MQLLPVKIIGNSMWPNFRDGQIVDFNRYNGEIIHIGDIVVFPNPVNKQMLLVKRVVSWIEDKWIVEGDNPDPIASTDSHNFGSIDISSIIAFRHNHNAE